MFEFGADDPVLLSCEEEEQLVRNLLSEDDPSSTSLSRALLPLVPPCSPPRAPAVPWACSTRYKTELCSSYSSSGSCRYAERCQFAHGLHELQVPSRHPRYKTELCRSFHSPAASCPYGARCLFVHGPAERRPGPPQRLRRRTVPCRTYRAFRVCPFGSRCHFLHTEVEEEEEKGESGGDSPLPPPPLPHPTWRPRGVQCRTFSSFGFCLFGTRCRFQHGLPRKSRPPHALTQKDDLPPLLSPGLSLSLSSSTSSSPSPSSPLDTPPSAEAFPFLFPFSGRQLSHLLQLLEPPGGARGV